MIRPYAEMGDSDPVCTCDIEREGLGNIGSHTSSMWRILHIRESSQTGILSLKIRSLA